ncbi:MAG TPA: FixH family protein [Ktedonobacterales bacterium]
MITQTTSVTAGAFTPSRRQGYIARGVILGSGLLVLALLVWVHLGLGALLFPPATDPARQVAAAGALRVTLMADSGEMLVGDHNTISLAVNDAAGKSIAGAKVTVAADMLDMPMPVPTVGAVWADGKYTAHPVFSMAGPWQLTVTISAPGQSLVHATFRVGVRWHA